MFIGLHSSSQFGTRLALSMLGRENKPVDKIIKNP